MANFVFNKNKGRITELAERVEANDPADAAFYVIPILTAGIETQANLEDSLTFTEVIDGTTDEATAGGWNRKTLGNGTLTINYDMTNNWATVDFADQTWTGVATANNVSALVLCYASVVSPTNAQLIPMTHHDFAVTTDGSDIVAVIATAGFFRAA